MQKFFYGLYYPGPIDDADTNVRMGPVSRYARRYGRKTNGIYRLIFTPYYRTEDVTKPKNTNKKNGQQISKRHTIRGFFSYRTSANNPF